MMSRKKKKDKTKMNPNERDKMKRDTTSDVVNKTSLCSGDEIKKISVEKLPKKKFMEIITPWLHLIISATAILVAIWTVRWSVNRTSQLENQNIEQQKISWTLTLISQLTSDNSDLQKFAATTFAALYEKGNIPDELLPVLKEAARDPNTNPDAAMILRNLIGSKRYKPTVHLGSNIMNCMFPVSLDNKRFFSIGSEKGEYSISVIVTEDNLVDFEIVNNLPRKNAISNIFITKSGTLVVSSLQTGNVVYKMKVGRDINVQYGDQVVNIDKDKIVAGGMTLTGNSIESAVGIILFKDGASALGGSLSNIPQNVLDLYKRALSERVR